MFLVEEVQKLDRSARWNYAFQAGCTKYLKMEPFDYISHSEVLSLETRNIVENFTLKSARKPENRNLNRYRDVLPYDHSRVELEVGSTNYINGNLIEVEEIGRKYILTQGPLPDTCGHFWQMVWEQNSSAIIMLNKIIEKNAVKCHPYWPMGEDEVIEFGDFSIKNLSERSESVYVVRDLQLEHTPSGKNRIIKQFHYMLWPDFGVPTNPELFLEFLYDIRDSSVFNPDQGPPVIHCSAGIGRSGTFCLVDSALLKAELDGKPDHVDVMKLLLHLRKYRVGLVQTPDQLRFSYIAIIQGLASMYPEAFKDGEVNTDESHKRKAEEEEPPPIPPRKRVPPEKPPRRIENVETTAAEESLKQKKMMDHLRDGVVDESSDESSAEEEVLDLSASEEEVELYETDEEDDEAASASNPQQPSLIHDDFSVDKPLPPLPKEAEDSETSETMPHPTGYSIEKSAAEMDAASTLIDKTFLEKEKKDSDMSNKREQLLPTFSAEDEEDATDRPKKEETGANDVNDTDAQKSVLGLGENAITETTGEPDGHLDGNLEKDVDHAASYCETDDKGVKGDTDDKAREERELRQRKRRDEKNKQTAATIEKIKKNMQEKEISAARRVLLKKTLIAVGITFGLFVGYYWLFG